MSPSNPELPDPYFPLPLPQLTGEVWARALAIAFHTDVYHEGGRIVVSGVVNTALRSPSTSVDDAVRHWSLFSVNWSEQLKRLSSEHESVNSLETSVVFFRTLVTEFEQFVDQYFNGVVGSWIEWARNQRTNDAVAASSHALQRLNDLRSFGRMVLESDEDLLDLIENTRQRQPLDELLRKWGAWSSTPEDFSRPYPREDPALLLPMLESLVRADLPERSVDRLPGGPVDVLLEIGEADNTFKYEFCYLLRQAIIKMGRLHPHLTESTVWHLALEDVESLDTALWTVDVPDDPRTPVVKLGATQPRRVFGKCEFVSPGTATAQLWDGHGELPDEDFILLAPGLAAGVEWAVVASKGVLAAQGSLIDHSAIVARELGIPCAISAGAYGEALTYTSATINGVDRTVILEG